MSRLFIHPRAQVPGSHFFGCRDHLADGAGKPVGEEKPYPNRGKKQHQPHHYEHHGKGDLNSRTPSFELFVSRDRTLRLFQVLKYVVVHITPDIEKSVPNLVEPDQCPHPVAAFAGEYGDPSIACRFDGPVRHHFEIQHQT